MSGSSPRSPHSGMAHDHERECFNQATGTSKQRERRKRGSSQQSESQSAERSIYLSSMRRRRLLSGPPHGSVFSPWPSQSNFQSIGMYRQAIIIYLLELVFHKPKLMKHCHWLDGARRVFPTHQFVVLSIEIQIEIDSYLVSEGSEQSQRVNY